MVARGCSLFAKEQREDGGFSFTDTHGLCHYIHTAVFGRVKRMGQGEWKHEPPGRCNKGEACGDRNRLLVEAGAWPLLVWRCGYDPLLNIQQARGTRR